MPRGVRLALLLTALWPVSAAPAADLAATAERVRQGTVLVEVAAGNENRSGTGFFLEQRGFVATALHTVEGGRRIRVSVPGAFAASDARLLAASSSWDIAILEVPWPEKVPYPGLPLDSDEPLRAGTEIAITGFGLCLPEALRLPMIVRGIVSGAIPNRDGLLYVLDLAASPGFSGGAVYRSDTGAVTAILTRVISERTGAGPGAAVPAGIIRNLVAAIQQHER